MWHGQLATTSRTGKVEILKPKAPCFYTAECSDINFFPQKIDLIFDFWAGQGLKLWRNTCFCWFKYSLALNFHVAKPERLALLKMWTSIFCLSKGPYDNDSWPISLGDLNIILSAWNGFSGKCSEICDRLFFLN